MASRRKPVEEDSAWIRRSYVSAQNPKLAWPPTKGTLKSTVLHLNKKKCQVICFFLYKYYIRLSYVHILQADSARILPYIPVSRWPSGLSLTTRVIYGMKWSMLACPACSERKTLENQHKNICFLPSST